MSESRGEEDIANTNHPRLHTFVPMEERTPSFVEEHVLWNRYRFKHAQEGRGLGLPHVPDLDVDAFMPCRCSPLFAISHVHDDRRRDRRAF